MLRRLVLTAVTAAAMVTAVPAAQAVPPSPDGAATSGAVAPMGWEHSGFYSSKANCDAVLRVTRLSGIPTAPSTGPCYYSRQHGFFYYWWD
ncbi:hypothetical protein [Jiangella endophytica]|uniref:hypothetical protein n=1 Tax=Jiangella endophytica TaxID=1623398 RepID=UPI0013005A6E|nr:hypothetical protein [Jiangella endophytica]